MRRRTSARKQTATSCRPRPHAASPGGINHRAEGGTAAATGGPAPGPDLHSRRLSPPDRRADLVIGFQILSSIGSDAAHQIRQYVRHEAGCGTSHSLVRPSGRVVALRCFDFDRKVLVTTDATI